MSHDIKNLTSPVTLLGPKLNVYGDRSAIDERLQLCEHHRGEYRKVYPTTDQHKLFVIEDWTDKPCDHCDWEKGP